MKKLIKVCLTTMMRMLRVQSIWSKILKQI